MILRRGALAALLLAAVSAPVSVASQADPADAAWRAGDTKRAVALYDARLARDSTDDVALHRVALARAWSGRYDESLALFDRLLRLAPTDLEARTDRARVQAWSGDVTGALGALSAVLGEHPDFAPALEARALFTAWSGNYREALSEYERALAIAPGDAALRRQRAQVLSWASELDASRAVYDSLVAADPGDVEARLGLARVLAIAEDLDGAAAQYRAVLQRDGANLPALQGLGRMLTRQERLVAGEATYRRALAQDPDNVVTLEGLAQNLRWQGRNAAALEVLGDATRIAPDNGDVQEQLRSVYLALAPRFQPRVVVEDDSDGNHMVSTVVTGSWHPVPAVSVRADAYQRSLDQNVLTRSAYGLTVSAALQAGVGWTLSGGLGGSQSDAADRAAFVAWNAALSTPRRYPAGASLTATSYALDATALMAERGVRQTEVTLAGRWRPLPGWRLDGSAGRATYEGTASNRRTLVAASVVRQVASIWSVGAGVRGFWFAKDLNDGYFDPDFYGLAEAIGGWRREPGSWSFQVELAPGVQQVTKAGRVNAAFRASGRVGYRIRPGRELSLAGGYSTTGLQSFSSGSASYRYTAVILGASWSF